MMTKDVILDQRQVILDIARRHGATNVRLFGSMARGDTCEESDVDLLVTMEPGRSLLDLGALAVELERLLCRKVDVVTEAGLRPRIRSRVLKEAISL